MCRHQRGQGPRQHRVQVVGKVPGNITGVRPEGSAQIVMSRDDLSVPKALEGRLSLHFKYNTVQTTQSSGKDSRVRSTVLVIAFRQGQTGIKGWPETPAKLRKRARLAHTHVTIERLPIEVRHALELSRRDRVPGDVPVFRISWWKPQAGQRNPGDIGGEDVLVRYGDLAVLRWLMENDLLALYDLPALVMREALPRRDPERETVASCLEMRLSVDQSEADAGL